MKTLSLLIGLTLITACTRPEKFIEAKLLQAIQTNPQRIDMAEYVPAAWDRMCVLRPGAPDEDVSGLESITGLRGDATDDQIVLLYVDGPKVMAAVNWSRSRGDFLGRPGSYCVERENAVYQVTDASIAEYRPIDLMTAPDPSLAPIAPTLSQ